MSNMSYCRWRNTSTDLRDCAEDLRDRVDGAAKEELSREEFEAACALIHRAQDMIGTIRNAVDVYGEADLTLDQIRDGLAKIEQEAQRYAPYEESDYDPGYLASLPEDERRQLLQDEAEQAERKAGWDRNP